MEESPLHPFELHTYVPINLGGLDISINKAVLIMWVVVALVSVLMVMAGSVRKLVPGKLQSLAEMLVDFIGPGLNVNITPLLYWKNYILTSLVSAIAVIGIVFLSYRTKAHTRPPRPCRNKN